MGDRGERTRQALLDASVDRFARDGYRATSVVEIARDAGLGGTAAYAYFASKEALFVAALDRDVAGVVEDAAAVVGADPDPNWIDALLAALLDALDRHRLARRILAGLEPEFTVRFLAAP